MNCAFDTFLEKTKADIAGKVPIRNRATRGICFIDLKLAFDKLDREKLFSRLLDTNIDRTLLAAIADLYRNTRL